MSDGTGGRTLDDFQAGDRIETGEIAVTRAMIDDFAHSFDPQPFHLDEAAAASSVFGRLVASGWHTAALTMRLLVDGRVLGGTALVGAGIDELRWPRAVEPGDRLRAVMEVLETRRSASNPARGLMRARTITVNQRGEPVQSMVATMILPTRPPSGAAA